MPIYSYPDEHRSPPVTVMDLQRCTLPAAGRHIHDFPVLLYHVIGLRRSGEPLVAKVFEVIEQHLDQPLSLRDVAREARTARQNNVNWSSMSGGGVNSSTAVPPITESRMAMKSALPSVGTPSSPA